MKKTLQWLWLMFVAVMGACALSIARHDAEAQITNIHYGTIQHPKSGKVSPLLLPAHPQNHSVRQGKAESGRIHVTGFSSQECHTRWCNAHRNQPRTYVAAVSSKYGHPKRIYIPAYDRFYKVIGTTDLNTDVDLWFGDDHDEAVTFGSKYLLVNFIY